MQTKLKKISILSILIITFFLNFFSNKFLDLEIRNLAYEQNHLNLQHIKSCMDNLEIYIKENNKTIDLYTKLNICASNSLVGGPTGDAFAVDLKTMKIIWDNSIDCKVGNESFLTPDSVCKLAKDPISCLELANKIKQGYPGDFEWQFDNDKEWTSWIILPNNLQNFDGSYRSTVGIKDQVALAQGTQKDEITEYLKTIKILLNIGTIIILFFFSILYLQKFKNNEL